MGIRKLSVGAITLALILGPTTAVQAASGDPSVMPDPQLRACVNAYLGQAPTEVSTENQAASVFHLDCHGFSDLTGFPALIDYQQGNVDFVGGITTLTELYLDNNALTVLQDLSGLINLYHLGVYDNELTDPSFVADLPSLGVLDVTENRVSDLTPLASAPGPLEVLYLSENAVLDLRPLASLNLIHMEAMDQLVELPEVPVGQGGDTPPRSLDGTIVPLLPGSAAVSVDAVAGSWLLAAPGAHSLTWNDTFTLPWSDVDFSGTIVQSALAATPQTPPKLVMTGADYATQREVSGTRSVLSGTSERV